MIDVLLITVINFYMSWLRLEVYIKSTSFSMISCDLECVDAIKFVCGSMINNFVKYQGVDVLVVFKHFSGQYVNKFSQPGALPMHYSHII